MSGPSVKLRPRVAAERPSAAMVLAAGLGRRMRPLTATRPKPMIEVGGRPLIGWVFDHLARAGVRDAVVNVHHFADQLEAYTRGRNDGLRMLISDERDRLMETGGGVTRALPQIASDPFYVINADNLWVDGPIGALDQLALGWRADRMDALLLLVPFARAQGYSGRGDFHMDQLGRLRRPAERRIAPYVFSGVQILNRRLFEDAPDEPFSLNRLYDRAILEGRAFGVVHGGLWYHVGTPAAVADTEEALARA